MVKSGSNRGLSDYRALALMTALPSSFMPGSEASGLHTLDSREQIGLEPPAWTGSPAQPHDSPVSHLFSSTWRRLVRKHPKLPLNLLDTPLSIWLSSLSYQKPLRVFLFLTIAFLCLCIYSCLLSSFFLISISLSIIIENSFL